jgi:hypothetical protein
LAWTFGIKATWLGSVASGIVGQKSLSLQCGQVAFAITIGFNVVWPAYWLTTSAARFLSASSAMSVRSVSFVAFIFVFFLSFFAGLIASLAALAFAYRPAL